MLQGCGPEGLDVRSCMTRQRTSREMLALLSARVTESRLTWLWHVLIAFEICTRGIMEMERIERTLSNALHRLLFLQ